MSNPKEIRLHFFRHVPFESPAFIGDWAFANDYTFTETKFYEDNIRPPVSSFDWLIIMGGPMNVYEYRKYPWLKDEKAYIEKALKNRKIVIGICLGAQMLADVLGARVFKADGSGSGYKEIGWFPVRFLKANAPGAFADGLPNECTVFHWHGDTFDLPAGSVHLAESDGCRNEAFLYDNRVLGLQFHMEMGRQNVMNIIKNCREDIKPGRYIQAPEEILKITGLYQKSARSVLYKILNLLRDNLEADVW